MTVGIPGLQSSPLHPGRPAQWAGLRGPAQALFSRAADLLQNKKVCNSKTPNRRDAPSITKLNRTTTVSVPAPWSVKDRMVIRATEQGVRAHPPTGQSRPNRVQASPRQGIPKQGLNDRWSSDEEGSADGGKQGRRLSDAQRRRLERENQQQKARDWTTRSNLPSKGEGPVEEQEHPPQIDRTETPPARGGTSTHTVGPRSKRGTSEAPHQDRNHLTYAAERSGAASGTRSGTNEAARSSRTSTVWGGRNPT